MASWHLTSPRAGSVQLPAQHIHLLGPLDLLFNQYKITKGSLGVMRPGREAYSRPCSADVKNAYGYSISTPAYAFMARCLIKHRWNIAVTSSSVWCVCTAIYTVYVQYALILPLQSCWYIFPSVNLRLSRELVTIMRASAAYLATEQNSFQNFFIWTEQGAGQCPTYATNALN